MLNGIDFALNFLVVLIVCGHKLNPNVKFSKSVIPAKAGIYSISGFPPSRE
jgi:hypothetical protein